MTSSVPPGPPGPGTRTVAIGAFGGPKGSGVLLAPDLVLTAFHVVSGGAEQVRVRLEGNDPSTDIEVAVLWQSPVLDVALLRCLVSPAPDPRRPMSWASASPGAVLKAEGHLYRDWSSGSVGPLRHYWAVAGEMHAGRLPLWLTDTDDAGLNGISGGAVTGPGGELVGIVVEGSERVLLAVPMAELMALPSFGEALGAAAGPPGETITAAAGGPLVAVLEPARRAPSPDRFGIWRLDPRSAESPLLGRTSELELLVRWCRDGEAGRCRVLEGPAGVGKTRLAVELCDRMAQEGWVTGFVNDSALRRVGRIFADRPTLVVVDDAESVPAAQVGRLAALGENVRVLLLARRAPRLPDHLVAASAMAVSNLPSELTRQLMASTGTNRSWSEAGMDAAVASVRTPLDAVFFGVFGSAGVQEPVERWIAAGDLPARGHDAAVGALVLTALLRPDPDDVSGVLASRGGGDRVVPASELARWLRSLGSDRLAFGARLPDAVVAALVELAPEPAAVIDEALQWAMARPSAVRPLLGTLARIADGGERAHGAVVAALDRRFESLVTMASTGGYPDLMDSLALCVGTIERSGREAPTADWRLTIHNIAGAGRLGFAGMGDRAAKSDRLDRTPIIDTLVEVLSLPPVDPGAAETGAAETERDPDASGPSVIAVDGPWGTGKTSLMRILEERLRFEPPRRARWRRMLSRAAGLVRARRLTVAGVVYRLGRWRERPAGSRRTGRGAAARTVTVWFNPWAHQASEQVWAGLARAILDAVQPQLCPSPNEKARYWLNRNAARVDRGALRRMLVRRVQSPLLRLGVLALLPPVAAALVRYDKTFHLFGHDRPATLVAAVLAAGVLALGVVHTVLRFLLGNAIAYCPAGFLDMPVLSGAFTLPNSEPGMRDPLYHARSGYLYLHQHDIQQLLEDARHRRLSVVVFIDDLDRCSPQTTVEVLGAVNQFLSEAYPARFVIGLDHAIVARHLDQILKDQFDAKRPLHPQDPSPGWTFLRKMVQLPVVLPRIRPETLGNLLQRYLGEAATEDDASRVPRSDAGSAGGTSAPEPIAARPADAAAPPPPNPAESSPPVPVRGVTEPPPSADRAAMVTRLEQNPEIRQCLRDRLGSWSDPSAREVKRLLTVWQFLLRVMAHDESRLEPPSGPESVRRARAAVVLAEIVVRWPAYLPRLLAVREDRQHLTDLAEAAGADEVTWSLAAAQAGFDRREDRKAADAIRRLLRHPDAKRAAGLAEALF